MEKDSSSKSDFYSRNTRPCLWAQQTMLSTSCMWEDVFLACLDERLLFKCYRLLLLLARFRIFASFSRRVPVWTGFKGGTQSDFALRLRVNDIQGSSLSSCLPTRNIFIWEITRKFPQGQNPHIYKLRRQVVQQYVNLHESDIGNRPLPLQFWDSLSQVKHLIVSVNVKMGAIYDIYLYLPSPPPCGTRDQ